MNPFKQLTVILLSFFIACMLSLVPLPEWVEWLRPLWVPSVLIYWVMAEPQRVGVGYAFCLGLLMDSLGGVLLGEHAFAFIVVAFLTLQFHLRIRMYPLMQQALSISVLLLVNQSVMLLIQGIIGQLGNPLLFLLPVITSTLLWPWVSAMLSHAHHRFESPVSRGISRGMRSS